MEPTPPLPEQPGLVLAVIANAPGGTSPQYVAERLEISYARALVQIEELLGREMVVSADEAREFFEATAKGRQYAVAYDFDILLESEYPDAE